LLRSDLTGTRGLCDQRAMRTAGLGGFLPYCLDGELLLVVECRPPQRCRANARRRRHLVPTLVAILPGSWVPPRRASCADHRRWRVGWWSGIRYVVLRERTVKRGIGRGRSSMSSGDK